MEIEIIYLQPSEGRLRSSFLIGPMQRGDVKTWISINNVNIIVTFHRRSWVPAQGQRIRLPPWCENRTGHWVPEQRHVCESHMLIYGSIMKLHMSRPNANNNVVLSNTDPEWSLWLPAVCRPQICCLHEQPHQGTHNVSWLTVIQSYWVMDWLFFIFVSLAVETFIYSLISTLQPGIKVSTQKSLGFLSLFFSYPISLLSK